MRYLLLALGVGFIGYYLFEYREQVVALFVTTNWPWFVAAFLLALFLSWFAAIYLWRDLTRGGVEISLLRTCVVFFGSQIAKYIPGRFWGILFQVNAVKLDTASHVIVIGNLKLIYLISTSMLALSVAVVVAYFNVYLFLPILAMGVGAAWLFLKHGVARLGWLLPGSLRRKIERLRSAGNPRGGMEFFLWSMLIAGSALVSTAMFIYSVFGYSNTQVLMLSAYQSAAWVISNLVVIVPAGIGVREGLFVLMNELNAIVDLDAVLLVAITMRLIQMFVDLVLGVIAYLLGVSSKS